MTMLKYIVLYCYFVVTHIIRIPPTGTLYYYINYISDRLDLYNCHLPVTK